MSERAVETQFQRKPAQKAKHPELPELVGAAFGAAQLRTRPDAAVLAPLIEMLGNAEYWLSFDVASFEPLLSKSPSPVRELGVAIALRFGEGIDGALAGADLARASEILVPQLPADLAAGLERAIQVLSHGVTAREQAAERQAEGFEPYAPATALSVHALMAGGRAKIEVEGAELAPAGVYRADLGAKLILRATDERGRPVDPPELESELVVPMLARKVDGGREVVLMVPGKYRLRVPGRAEGSRWLLGR